MVKILVADVDKLWQGKDDAADTALLSLPPSIYERIASYKIKIDRQLRMTAILLLQQLLQQEGQGYTIADILRAANNRPFLPDSGIDFSISHSSTIAACALSTEGNVGIDIEEVKPTDWQYLAHLFEPDDWNAATGQGQAALYELWAKREACIKATDDFEVREGPFSFDGWHLHPLAIDGQGSYAGVTATRFPAEYAVGWVDSLP